MNETVKESKSAALYIRVSTHDQEELSPDSQRRLLLDYAKSHQMQVSPEYIYQENGVSGRKAEKRPEFQRMIAAAKSSDHPFDVILVWKFSRFARNQEESIVYKSMLRNKCSVEVISISEPLVDGPFGSLIERIIEWMDEFYSIRLSGDVTRGMTEKALRGGYQCRPPLGYRIPYHNAVPEIVPEEAKIIQLIFDQYVNSRMSLFAIAKMLNRAGFKTGRGKPFEKRSVEYILQNPGYAGDIRWNRTIGETSEIRDPSEWIIRPGHHPAIISKELFQQAQARFLSERRSCKSRPAETSRHWLSGLMKCPECGRTLSSCVRRRKTLPDSCSFQCYGYLKGKCRCNCYVSEETIAPNILKALQETLTLETISYSAELPLKRQASNELELVKSSLARLEIREKRARDAYLDGIDTKEEYRANKEQFQKERKYLESALHSLSSPSASQETDEKSQNTVMLENIQNVYDILTSDLFTTAQKNAALKSIVKKIVYFKEQNHFDIYFYLA